MIPQHPQADKDLFLSAHVVREADPSGFGSRTGNQANTGCCSNQKAGKDRETLRVSRRALELKRTLFEDRPHLVGGLLDDLGAIRDSRVTRVMNSPVLPIIAYRNHHLLFAFSHDCARMRVKVSARLQLVCLRARYKSLPHLRGHDASLPPPAHGVLGLLNVAPS